MEMIYWRGKLFVVYFLLELTRFVGFFIFFGFSFLCQPVPTFFNLLNQILKKRNLHLKKKYSQNF
jgi:hypothetical protein